MELVAGPPLRVAAVADEYDSMTLLTQLALVPESAEVASPFVVYEPVEFFSAVAVECEP